MSADGTAASALLAELRGAFDRAFAEPPHDEVVPLEDLLHIQVSGRSYALRIAEISGLLVDARGTTLPTPVPELIGLTAFRGTVLPVYDLAAMLGHATDTHPRWLAIAAGTAVGLAFERLEGHMRVRREAIVPHSRAQTPTQHVRTVVHARDRVLPIVSVASILEAITSRVRPAAPSQEH